MNKRRVFPPFRDVALAFALGAAVGLSLVISGVAIAAAASAVADAPAGDSLVALLQATGFPTWAIVVAVMGKQVVDQLKAISERLNEHITQTENRLTRLEEINRLRAAYHIGVPEQLG